MMKPIKKVGVIGLGYIGLPLVAALASRGFEVVGIDVDREKISRLRKTYKVPIHEPGVNETLQRCRRNIQFAADQQNVLRKCDAILVTVGTPVSSNGYPNLRHLDSVVESIGPHLQPGQLIMFKSTVFPGVTRKLNAKLEKLSRLKSGRDFYVVFCPERTIEGRALEELYTLPKIIGGINKESLDRGAEFIGRLGGRVIKVSSLEVAEMCKCVDNSYRVANIAFANEIGDLCEKIGIDAYELVSAANTAYPRTNLFFPGLGAGGPCLSKDPKILNYFAQNNNINTPVINASIIKSRESTVKVVPVLTQFIKKYKIARPKISLAGLAFKGFPETDDIRNSPAVEVYNLLAKTIKKPIFNFYDPIIKNFLGHSVAPNLEDCFKNANAIIFLTNHQNLLNIKSDYLLKHSARPLLIADCWHNLSDLPQEKNVHIFRIGGHNYGETAQ